MLWQPMHEGGAAKLSKLFKGENKSIYWSGVAAFGTLIWIVFSSLGVFRRMSYGFFVFQHICSIILILGFLFHHTKDLSMLKSPFFLWAAVAFWIFSIVVRSILVLVSSKFFSGPRAKVEVQTEVNIPEDSETRSNDGEFETLRFSFQTPLRWSPGQHIYVRFPGFNPVQAHPFSIMSVPSTKSNVPSNLVLLTKVHRGTTRKIFNYVQSLESNYEETYFKNEMNLDTLATMDEKDKTRVLRSSQILSLNDLPFPLGVPPVSHAAKRISMCGERTREGSGQENESHRVQEADSAEFDEKSTSDSANIPTLLTDSTLNSMEKGLKRTESTNTTPTENNRNGLWNARRASNIHVPASRVRSTRILAYLDGPYGHATDPATFEHVVLYSGGTGIAHIFPLIVHLLQRSKNEDKKVLTKSIRLIWCTKSMAMVNWLREELLEIYKLQCSTDVKVTIDIHITTESKNPVERSPISGVTSHFGSRADVKATLKEEFQNGMELGSHTVGIYVCGPTSMVCDVSNHVAASNFNIVRGRMGSIKDIMLEVEHFSW